MGLITAYLRNRFVWINIQYSVRSLGNLSSHPSNSKPGSTLYEYGHDGNRRLFPIFMPSNVRGIRLYPVPIKIAASNENMTF